MRRILLVTAMLMALAGCKTDLYSNISEREANEMMSILLTSGIEAEKLAVKDGNYTLQVDNGDVARALALLDSQGLPRGSRKSIGEVFQRQGMISSPFEERVRYVHALGEEVAQTIQQIDGVLVARVHVVMPEEPALGQQSRPFSAAVFIRQQAGFDLEYLTPQIRRLVASSIEGVPYESVTVVLVEAQPVAQAHGNGAEFSSAFPGIHVRNGSVGTFWALFAAMSAVIIGMGSLLGWIITQGRIPGRGAKKPGQGEDAA